MNNINKLITLLLLFFSINNSISAQCDYTDDFDTLPPADATNFTSGHINTTTTAGWTGDNIQVVTGGTSNAQRNNYKPIGIGKQGITLGGQNQIGSITSPEYTNGCDSLSFSYCKANGTDPRSIKIEVIQNGTAILICDTTILLPSNSIVYTFSKKIDITGKYKLKITKTAAEEQTLMIWDFCITSQSATPPSISLAGEPRAEGGFWDKANVTLSAGEGSAIYYTLDGTDPTSASTPYAVPFDLTQTTQIKAISVKDGTSSAALDTTVTVIKSPYSITVPENATVFVGVPTGKGYNYRPFTEKQATYSTTADGKKTWYYDVSGSHNYRISRADALTFAGVFTPSGGSLEITEAQLTSHAPKKIDHDVTHLNGRNVADIFLNINAQGHLHLPKIDTVFQIVNQRNWQTIDTDVSNYFFQPDYHYTVLDESGVPSNAVITVSSTGLITPVGNGTAIVLITYDAMICTHTSNVGDNGNAFFSALWPENTGAFVVTVGEKGAGITSNMTVSEYWNSDGSDKTSGIAIDSEHDVLYYEAAKGGFDYTFKPEGVLDVTLAQPTIGENAASYSTFSQDGVKKNADGSYTVHLTEGRNIVQLISTTNYQSDFQIITAKPITYTINNVTRPDATPDKGDSISVKFNTLYHPCNKMAGIYNMSAGIQYSAQGTNFPLILGPGQYTFASAAQEYGYKIPEDYNGDDIMLTEGVIKVKGYGSYYGEHRYISLVDGVPPNLNASVREAYFGSIPEIHIRTVGAPPTQPGSLQTLGITSNSIVLKWTASTDNVGVEGYTIWVNGDSLTTIGKEQTVYSISDLTPQTGYTFEVAAFDAAGNHSTKAVVTASTLTTGLSDVAANAFVVYPNPFTDYIVFESAKDGYAVIYDSSGKAILTAKIEAGSNQLNTTAIQKGVYILKYENYTVKIVK
jgi:hypothetical protein